MIINPSQFPKDLPQEEFSFKNQLDLPKITNKSLVLRSFDLLLPKTIDLTLCSKYKTRHVAKDSKAYYNYFLRWARNNGQNKKNILITEDFKIIGKLKGKVVSHVINLPRPDFVKTMATIASAELETFITMIVSLCR